jgi:hypothetical protein
MTRLRVLVGSFESHFLLRYDLPSQMINRPFWLTFKKLDVKPIRLQMRTYYSILLPSLAGLVAFILLFYKKYMSWIMAR